MATGPTTWRRCGPTGRACCSATSTRWHARTRRLLEGLRETDLDRIVDKRWDPPVTLGVRLISIADDCLQHAGQAAYLRGLL